ALAKRRNDLLRDAKPTDKIDYWRNAITHYVCAERAYLEGEPVERIAGMLNEAFAEGIDFGLARSLRGQLNLERGRLALALADGEKALAQNAQDSRGYFVRG